MVRAMVHSVKHYVQFPIDQIGMGTSQSNRVMIAIVQTSANIANEISEGSTIKAVFFELWLQNEGTLSEFIVTISKNPEDGTGPTFAEQASLFTYTNKKNVLYTTQGLTPNDGVSGPINVLRGWIKIPKSKQRFGLGDSLTLNISNVSTNDLVRCGFCTFKEYS